MNGPKQALFAVLQRGVDQLLALDAEACADLDALEGRSLELHLTGLDVTLRMAIDGRRLVLLENPQDAADARISGPPLATLALAMKGGEAAMGRVKISGDAEVSRRFSQFLERLDLDFEEPLCQICGDFVGHRLAMSLRHGAQWANDTAEHGLLMLGDFLAHESRQVASAHELAQFAEQVDNLRDALGRLDARLSRLESVPGHD